MKNKKYRYSKIKYFFTYTIWKPFRAFGNLFFLAKYPFMWPTHVWTGKRMFPSHTSYDLIPYGWQKAFGKNLLKDLRKAWIDSGKPKFYFNDIKEKYGTLRLYINQGTDAIYKVIHHYEHLSQYYCIECGERAEYATEGWIEYLCEPCFMDYLCSDRFESDNELLKYLDECKLEKNYLDNDDV